jgi:hypothetical protein
MPTSSGFQVNEILTAANTNTYLLRPYTNAIINGAMNIAQRGTSQASITGAGYYTADRWYHQISALGTWTDTVQALTSSDAPLQDGVRNSLKITCTTANASPAAGAYNVIQQAIEGFNAQQFSKGNTSAKQFALSFWVRSNRTGTYIAELYDSDNSRTISASYTITASGVWQKVRIVFAADITGALANSNTQSLTLLLWLGAGSNFTSGTLQTAWGAVNNTKRAVGQVNLGATTSNYFEMTAVQLEPNNVCTPFEVREIGTELAMCQRYFLRLFSGELSGSFYASTASMLFANFPVEMRAVPVATLPPAPYTNALLDYGVAFRTPSVVQANAITTKAFVIVAYNGFVATYTPTTWYGGAFSLSAEL